MNYQPGLTGSYYTENRVLLPVVQKQMACCKSQKNQRSYFAGPGFPQFT
jgi:hypothetical protein